MSQTLTSEAPLEGSSHASFDLPSQQPDFDALAQSIPSSIYGPEPDSFISDIEASPSNVPLPDFPDSQPHNSAPDPTVSQQPVVLDSFTSAPSKQRKRTSLLSVGRRLSHLSASSSSKATKSEELQKPPTARRPSVSSQRKQAVQSRVDWTLNLAFLGVAPHQKVVPAPVETRLSRRNSIASSVDPAGFPGSSQRVCNPNRPFAPIFEDDRESVSYRLSSNYSYSGSESSNDMGLMRHLTLRGRSSSRAGSQKKMSARPQISLPTTLISTTNGLVYNAPDIYATQQKEASSPTSSQHSRGSSDISSEPPLTDASSVNSDSPAESPHATAYFPGGAFTPQSEPMSDEQTDTSPMQEAPPAIPRRSPSHTRREHERLARARSVRSSTGARPMSLQNPHSIMSDEAAGLENRKPVMEQHPFSNELEQLQEVAEEFGTVSLDTDPADDNRVMSLKGLNSFRASDYMNELGTVLTPFEENVHRL